MTRIGILLGLSLAMAGCSQKRPEEAPPPPGFSDEGEAAGQRIGAYLQSSVVAAKLRACWDQLKAEGAVATDLTYRKSGDTWTFDSVKVTRSTLSKDQDAIAQRCIEESAGGTSFEVDSKQELEQLVRQFVVRLGWSVPLPAEGTEMPSEQLARMIGTGGAGGVITVPGCSDCQLRGEPPYGYKCVAKKSGSQTDCEEVATNVCATTPKACLRGVFGGTRGVIMY
jgi:hypothetical protein